MIKKLIAFVLSSLVYSSISDPFIKSTIYSDVLYLILFIVAVNFIEIFVEKTIIRISLQLIALYVMVYSYLPMKPAMLIPWVESFTRHVISNLSGFILRTNNLIEYDVGIFSVGIFLILLIKFTARKQRVWEASAVILLYFFMLIAFNNIIIKMPLYQLVLFAIIWQLWTLYDFDLLRKPFYTCSVFVLVGVLFFGSLNYPVLYKDAYTTVKKFTDSYRMHLSEQGFYRIFQLNRISGLGAYSGYSLDDSFLGGPMQMNYNTVFKVKQTRPTYWKLENKYIYTGKGWEKDTEILERDYFEGMTLQEQETHGHETTETSQITYVAGGLPFVPVPFGNVTFDSLATYRWLSVGFLGSQSIHGFMGFSSIELPKSDQTLLENVMYSWISADISEHDLRSVAVSDALPSEWLFLPSLVTQRTRDLAQHLVAEADNQYDRVKAIQTYLTENDSLKYGLESVQYTPDNREFVDYFLFDMKEGYCEHYSTAMVVLLRAVGIPARWAKGYSTGVISDAANNEYTIRNADAHAWVEVYFGEYGWLPFEATPTFDFNFLDQDESPQTPDNPTANPSDPDHPNTPDQNLPQHTINPSRPDAIDNTQRFDWNHLKPADIVQYIMIGFIMVGGLYFALNRLIVMFWIRILIIRGRSFKKLFIKVLHCVEWQFPRPQSVGVELYATLLPEALRDTYVVLMREYVELYYGDKEDHPVSAEEKARFRQLIKSISLRKMIFKK